MSKVLVIDRAKWNTGDPTLVLTGPMALLNTKGFMCCLGFECIRRGFTPDKILKLGEPSELNVEITDLSIEDDGSFHSTDFVRRAIDINDDPKLLKVDREEQIREHFSTIGVEVQFINQYA